ncbi:uncharacterized protein LOC114359718 isoform X1 [Ostrinia furnacalis]|uniref:uncharacterized protein LOC114359718 isoform X1 n=1 Tax=Ostrinia furnacalis TaxID=93504 RepID=UPI00103903BA|nr:uncharacterized protein LOC114359718 isoform X1 [Ostrinia furnacalis]
MDLEVLYEELRGMEVTNPACMDKIMSYKEDIELEADDYMHVLVESLSHAMITWEQPWYQEQDKLSLQPLIENRDGLPKFREDPITKDEGEHILNNWRKLVKKYNIPDKLQCFARWRNIGYNKRSSAQENVRRFIHSYLARGLNRTIPQVYRHIVNTYRRTKKGRYTPDEEKLMEICFYHYPPRAVRIASFVLDRGDKGITKRFLVSRNGKPEFNRIKWTLPLATKLVNLLVKYTGEESYDGLKNKPIHISIWRDVENHFDTLACYLRHFWYTSLHCQLFIKYDVTLRRVRRRVFKM